MHEKARKEDCKRIIGKDEDTAEEKTKETDYGKKNEGYSSKKKERTNERNSV